MDFLLFFYLVLLPGAFFAVVAWGGFVLVVRFIRWCERDREPATQPSLPVVRANSVSASVPPPLFPLTELADHEKWLLAHLQQHPDAALARGEALEERSEGK